MSRTRRLAELMQGAGLDALLCSRPENVLLLTGYWPSGRSSVLYLPSGEGAVIAPEDDYFARDAAISDIRTFTAETAEYILPPTTAAVPEIALACCEKGVSRGVVGMDEPPRRLAEAMPYTEFRDATELLALASAVKTPDEVERIRLACAVAEQGFRAARIRPGAREVEISAEAEAACTLFTGFANIRRVEARACCTSGRKAELHPTNRRVEPGDSVLLRIDCRADGYLASVTRTYFAGEPTEEQRRAHALVLGALEAGLCSVAEGRPAREVDSAVRAPLREAGYELPRGAGHGIGFGADPPAIHPASDEILGADMVFTLESALPGIAIRDTVQVRGAEAKILSGFSRSYE
ncbi:MAG: M24 family metallopeptidase [Armatimonadota bacterium]